MSQRRYILAFALWCMGTTPLPADALNSNQMQALTARIAAFDRAVETSDIAAIESVVPPKLIASMAAQFGVDPENLRASMQDAMKSAMAQVTVLSYNMALDTARFKTSAQGRDFALIPSRIVMEIDGQKMEGRNHTLAFADEGVWYLVRVDDANQVRFLKQAYPEFADVDFPAGTMTVIDD